MAYNRSGDVVIGTVISLTYGRRFPAKIISDPDTGYRSNKVSTVKNPRSVLVLKPGDEDGS